MGKNSKKKRYIDPYSEEYIKEHRRFPALNTVLILLLVALQILLVIFALTFDPQPQDIIHNYEITVEPREDGSLDITYFLEWEALDNTEALTWIDVGMPNDHFTIYPSSLQGAVASAEKYVEEDYVSARLQLNRAYFAGDRLQIGFQINQKQMLCRDDEGYFYELIPGWFNATPVEHYTFRWVDSDGVASSNAAAERFSYHLWEGSMECGTYVSMKVRYKDNAFHAPATVEYHPFDDSGVNDDLRETKIGMAVMVAVFVLLLVLAEVYLADSFVSYNRGRGFLTGYGYHVHTYGRVNPRYREEQRRRSASSGHGGSGGGCACACACACAGGGRAGCSQKDTYGTDRRA